MSTPVEDPTSPPRTYAGRIAYRVPKDLEAAAATQAAYEQISMSDVARRALLYDLRNRGLLRESG